MSWFSKEWQRPSGIVADVMRLAMLASVLVSLVAGTVESFAQFTLLFLILLGTRVFGAPRPFDAAFGATLLIAGWARSLRWYEQYPWTDIPVHFVATGAMAAMLYLILAQLDLLPDLHDDVVAVNPSSAVLLTTALGVTAGVVWEFYEWAIDTFAPGTMIIVGYTDTIGDLAMDTLGSVVAGLFLVMWAKLGFGTEQRTDADPRGRDETETDY